MTRAVGNGMIQTLANAIGTGAVGKLAKQVAGLSADMANIKSPEKGSGLMFNPDTGKLYIPTGNGVTVNKNTGMLEVPIGDNLRYTGSGLDVPDADETTAGVVKLTHEVSNRDDGEWAITADGVYAYAPGYKTDASNIAPSVTFINNAQGEIAYAIAAGGILFLGLYSVVSIPDKYFIEIAGYATTGTLNYNSRVGNSFVRTNLENYSGGVRIKLQAPITISAAVDCSFILPIHKL